MSDPSGRSVGRAQVHVSMWVLFAASLLITGWEAICGNHAVQIPLVRWLNDRSLYPHDPFMTVLARYPSALWPLVALGARVFPLEGLLIALLVLERLFVLYAAGRLARAFAPRSGLAVVAATAVFAFAVKPLLGSGTIVQSYFEHTGLAIALLLLAAAAFEESRAIAWAVYLAAAFDINPMYGIFALSYFGPAFALDPDHRRAWTRWARPLLLFLVLASPALYAVISAGSIPPFDETLWLTAARARCWFRFYPLTWNGWGFVQFGVLLSLAVTVLGAARRERPRLFRHGLVWSVVACLWVTDAFAAAYVLGSRRLMMMQPARATDLWICLATIAVVAVAAERIEGATDPRIRLGWTIALGAAFLAWLPSGAFAVTALILIAALPPPVARRISPRAVAWLLVAWVSMVGAAAVPHLVRHYSRANFVTWGPDRSIREIAAWARASTPLDSVFLVNPGDEPDFGQFMGLAERSIFTNWEEGTALYWAPDFVTEWTARLGAVGVDITRPDLSLRQELNENFQEFDDDTVARLKQRYRLSYWVVPAEKRSRFPVVFWNSHYHVLDVR